VRYSKVDSSVWGAFFLLASKAPPPQKKNFSPFLSFQAHTRKKSSSEKKERKKVRLSRRRRFRRRREILVAFTRDEDRSSKVFICRAFTRAFFLRCFVVVVWAFVVALFLAFSRATLGKDLCCARGARKGGDFFIRTFARKKRGWCFGGRRERVDADFEL